MKEIPREMEDVEKFKKLNTKVQKLNKRTSTVELKCAITWTLIVRQSTRVTCQSSTKKLRLRERDIHKATLGHVNFNPL